MSQPTTTKCYIEEYEIDPGRTGARLRDKATGRKVNLGMARDADKQNFLQFLNGAQMHRAAMPHAFTREGHLDCVAVSGDLDFDAPDEIRYVFNENLSYLFA